MSTTDAIDVSRAIISDCGRYRYRLERGSFPRLGICMLNPSTADASEDDPTIRRVRDFAARFGYKGIDVVNVYALRATDPKALLDCSDPFGDNYRHLQLFGLAHADYVVCAWGANVIRAHAIEAMANMRRGLCGPFKDLGRTIAGHPKHPLYLKKETLLQPFSYG